MKKRFLLIFVICIFLFCIKVNATTCEYSFPMYDGCLASGADKSDANFYMSFDINSSSGLSSDLKITYGKDRKSVYNGSFWNGSSGNALEIRQISQSAVDVAAICRKAHIKVRVTRDNIKAISNNGSGYSCPEAGWFDSYTANNIGETTNYSTTDYWIWLTVRNSKAASSAVKQSSGGNSSTYTTTEECGTKTQVLTSRETASATTCIRIQYKKTGGKYIPEVKQFSSSQCMGELTNVSVTDKGNEYWAVVQKKDVPVSGIGVIKKDFEYTAILPYVNSCSEADQISKFENYETTDKNAVEDYRGNKPKEPSIGFGVNSMTCQDILGKNLTAIVRVGTKAIQIIGAIVAIVNGMITLIPAVMSKDADGLKKAEKKLVLMAIVLLCIFLLPYLVHWIGSLFDYDTSCFF